MCAQHPLRSVTVSPIIAFILLGIFVLILVGAIAAVASSLGKRHGSTSGPGHHTKSRKKA